MWGEQTAGKDPENKGGDKTHSSTHRLGLTGGRPESRGTAPDVHTPGSWQACLRKPRSYSKQWGILASSCDQECCCFAVRGTSKVHRCPWTVISPIWSSSNRVASLRRMQRLQAFFKDAFLYQATWSLCSFEYLIHWFLVLKIESGASWIHDKHGRSDSSAISEKYS